jgi:membrane dipeptidase
MESRVAELSAGPSAAEIHREAIVFDGLDVCLLDDDHVEKLLAGGVTAVNHTVTLADGCGFKTTVERMLAIREFIRARPEQTRLIRDIEDIDRAKHLGQVGFVLGLQNANSIENDLRFLEALFDLGLRIVQLTYNTGNLLGDGCLEQRNSGLTAFGVAAIREMNRLGILVDLSHVGERSCLEAIECSDAPVAITHANCRRLHASPRNKNDVVLRALADAGGVLGLTPLPSFLVQDPDTATLQDYVDHIDYAVDLMGIDHVGLGFDFTTGHTPETLVPEGYVKWGGTHVPGGFDSSLAAMRAAGQSTNDTLSGQPYAAGIADHSQVPNVATELESRGYPATAIEQILGLNLLRVFGSTSA